MNDLTIDASMKSDTRSPSSRRSAGGRSTASAPTEATARKQRRIQAEQDRRDGAGAANKVAKFGSKTEMGRPAQPEELSPAYVFLAAPVCAGYITGIVLPVTGSVGAI